MKIATLSFLFTCRINNPVLSNKDWSLPDSFNLPLSNGRWEKVQLRAETQERAWERQLSISLVPFLAPQPTPAVLIGSSVSSERALQPFRKSVPWVSGLLSSLQVNVHTISQLISTQATNDGNKCLPILLSQM